MLGDGKNCKNIRYYFLCKAVFCDVNFLDEIRAQAETVKTCLLSEFLLQINFRNIQELFLMIFIVPFERKFAVIT